MFKILVSIFLIINSIKLNESHIQSTIECDLNNCSNLNEKYRLVNTELPFQLDGSKLIWKNKYQSKQMRWSQLCPSNYLISQNKIEQQKNNNYCLNANQCDSIGYCTIQLEQISNKKLVQLNLIDNLEQMPQFPQEMKFFNLTFDLENYEENNIETVLIESTQLLDPFRSKINRNKIEFQLDTIQSDDEIFSQYCTSTSSYLSNSKNSFISLRNDLENEKLYIRFTENSQKQEPGCFVYRLNIKKSASSSSAILVVNLIDNRFEKPIFEYQTYNFTIDENSPLNTLIGQVRAVYLNKEDIHANEKIKYKVIPFGMMSSSSSFDLEQLFFSDSNDEFNNKIQVKIDPTNGQLLQKSNIDREKYLMNNLNEPSITTNLKSSLKSKQQQQQQQQQTQQMGLIRFNIEASYESMSYGYAKVNIYVRDINDNPPMALIRPLSEYAGNKKTSAQKNNDITNLYVNENTATNQILAYIAINDPDAGENGTIKSIDLTLLSHRKASNLTMQQREYKYEQLKKFHQKIQPLKNRNDFAYERISCLLQQYSKLTNKNQITASMQQTQLPFKLNRISEKFYTLQLQSKLDFKQIESYSIEMRIQDNGTHPQLESKTRINLNVLDQNDNYPIFLNAQNEITLIENKYYEQSVIFKANAIDLDDDYNGLIKYSLVNNPFGNSSDIEAKYELESTFHLNKDTGELKLLKPLNSNKLNENKFDLIIMAIDQSNDNYRLNKTLKLRVNILDLNNNKPKFDLDNYEYKFDLTNDRINVNQANAMKQIASSIYLTDLDSIETNSKDFINENILKLKNDLIDEMNSIYSISTRPKFLFNDEQCLKTFNLNTAERFSDNLNFLTFFIESTKNEKTNQVKCKMSIWLDTKKFNSNTTLNNNNNNKLSLNFDLQLQDYGLKNETSDSIISKANFKIEITKQIETIKNDISFLNKSLHLSQNKTNENTYLIEFNNEMEINAMNSQLEDENDSLLEFDLDTNNFIDCQLKSVEKLSRYLNDSRKIDLSDLTYKFKLEKSTKSLNRFRLISSNGKKQKLGVYLVDLYLINNLNMRKLLKIDLIIFDDNKRNQTLTSGHSLLAEYRTHIDNLLQMNEITFGKQDTRNSANSIENNDSAFIQFQNLLFGNSNNNLQQDSILSQLGNFFISNNRSTFIQIIIISLIISIIILATLIFCIILLIRKNCAKANKQHKKGKKLENRKSINVTDDDSCLSNESNTAGAGFMIINENSDMNESKEKVNRYLDGCIILAQHQTSQTVVSSSSNSPTSSSSNSVVDSKKNLIIQTSNNNNNKNRNSNKTEKLSTTSSSCISDEGCYGSSDFSTDTKLPKKSILVNSNYHQNSSSITRHQKNYCINNLSRFEKIYNNKTEDNLLDEFDSNIYVKSSQQTINTFGKIRTTVNSSPKSIISNNAETNNNNNNVQVITSISGSYV